MTHDWVRIIYLWLIGLTLGGMFAAQRPDHRSASRGSTIAPTWPSRRCGE